MMNKMQRSNRLFLILGLIFSLVGCVSLGPNATYYMGTTSFNYDPSYNSYMVKMNGSEIGGGFGNATLTSSIKVGEQVITWKNASTGEKHTAKNQVTITKEQLKGKKYLAVHLYPDDTVEITISNNWPMPTEKGLSLLDQFRR
ncbi:MULTISPECIES: hypothetical protein [Acinetobacter]|uniref:Uncharacterized protein n=3 Tax=Acinetobacter nosocomialis TaxID=106654 RepID=A0A2T7FIV1_ACINO|nr:MULTISPECIES: hypothetical protein [Acinetobacter]AZC06507.1 hypothetical protein DKE44_014115 [Acinetobacter nosocomialis]EEW99236.1 hypothetical protein HMPREF0014_02359 [Acinetobacter sp. RUH 2624]EKF48029.1 hypothetical protein W9I_02853 [Acinetobacter nosocomialis Ab22222]EKU6035536.1 hypothetical protein [Acinetobacter nosocomialis]ENV40492.1 hypothetical protein F958_03524 [Acinetobacter nosocomialis NIPH 386]